MAQRKYDSFAVGILNDGNAAVHIDLSINVWADVRHSSEIDFGIQIPHKDVNCLPFLGHEKWEAFGVGRINWTFF